MFTLSSVQAASDARDEMAGQLAAAAVQICGLQSQLEACSSLAQLQTEQLSAAAWQMDALRAELAVSDSLVQLQADELAGTALQLDQLRAELADKVVGDMQQHKLPCGSDGQWGSLQGPDGQSAPSMPDPTARAQAVQAVLYNKAAAVTATPRHSYLRKHSGSGAAHTARSSRGSSGATTPGAASSAATPSCTSPPRAPATPPPKQCKPAAPAAAKQAAVQTMATTRSDAAPRTSSKPCTQQAAAGRTVPSSGISASSIALQPCLRACAPASHQKRCSASLRVPGTAVLGGVVMQQCSHCLRIHSSLHCCGLPRL